MRIALYEPDIAPNAGAIMRTAACLGVALDIIGPCGFALDDRRLRRAGLDYRDSADVCYHDSWSAFRATLLGGREAPENKPAGRLILLTRHAPTSYIDFRFRPDDVLMVGRESAGVPATVAEAADARVTIPIRAELRSLNVSVAAAIVLGEALRQTNLFPRMIA